MIGAVISIFLQLSQCGPDVDTLRASQISVPKPPALAVSTLDRKSIESLPSTSVADAIRLFSGVQVKDYGGIGGLKTVNVRSLGSQHVGVYLDGVRITNAQNGTVDLGKYSLTTLESVSLFNANKTEPLMTASEYASASTIYLRTRRPDSTSLTVVTGPAEGTAIGNIMLQAKAAGLAGDIYEMRQVIAKSIDTCTYQPADREKWNKGYEAYLKVTG